MCIQLLSFDKLRELIKEQQHLPDLYEVTPLGPHNINLCRDNYEGMEAAIQTIGTTFGMTVPRLGALDQRLGWLCVIQPDQKSA
ncbi:hypothetical protein ACFL6U_09320 [Planctomycetota bacterium]